MDRKSPVGVFDSGIGGFSSVKELQKQLPGEDIVYFGDSLHVPYGSRSEAELLYYVRCILRYMAERRVKAIVIACNTTASLIEKYRAESPAPLFSIIETGCAPMSHLGAQNVGVLCTPFTAERDLYGRILRGQNPGMKVVSASCPHLAQLIEMGRTSVKDLAPDVCGALSFLRMKLPLTHLILGCTHYPLALESFRLLCPGLTLLDPAQAQAASLKEFLTDRSLLNEQRQGRLELFTSGDEGHFGMAAKRFGLKNALAPVRLCLCGE